MKSGDIVVYSGNIGRVVVSDKLFKFKPCNSGSCYYSELDTIIESDIREATQEEKLQLIASEYTWGKVVNIHCVGEYQIVESIKDNEIHWHGYIDYKDTHVSYSSLDSALVGCIGIKYEGGNGRAAMYFNKMVGMI